MALRLATDEHWDLLVTDLDMPGMTGLELLGALRQVAPGLPVAVVSAHALDGAPTGLLGAEIGRASCRERVFSSV